MPTTTAAHTLVTSLGESALEPSFFPLVRGIRDVLLAAGIPVDRLQVPMSRRAGFRHPTLAVVAVTWCHERDFEESFVISHDRFSAPPEQAVPNPYRELFEHGRSSYRMRPTATDAPYPLLGELHERGYRDYCAIAIDLPAGFLQPISIASKSPFPDDLEARIAGLLPLISLAIYGAYRTSQAVRLARAYIGPRAGPEVLAGNIRRGSTHRLTAGILFCDIRGFTSLSEREAPESVVAIVNEVFTMVEAAATTRGGEILKFIGDAMLLVFPVDETPATVARAMVETARHSQQQLARSGLGVGVCFGGHIGEVVQGNVGTPERLDFTVMGPAVNLASRLESLCRPLQTDAVFSEAVARHVDGLEESGAHSLKGIDRPVTVFALQT